jgi:hypothetical protein
VPGSNRQEIKHFLFEINAAKFSGINTNYVVVRQSEILHDGCLLDITKVKKLQINTGWFDIKVLDY